MLAVCHAQLKVLKVRGIGVGAARCGGVPEVRALAVALTTACKVVSSPLLVTGIFFSSYCFLFHSGIYGTSGCTHRVPSEPHAMGRFHSALSSFITFFLLLFMLGPHAPIHHRGTVSMAWSQGSGAQGQKLSHHSFSCSRTRKQMKVFLTSL